MIDQETLKLFDEWYHKTYDMVLKYIICHCSKIEDIEDIIQNVYLDVYNALVKHKDLSENYIMGITKHKVKDYYRYKYKERIVSFFSKESEDGREYDIPQKFDLENIVSTKYEETLVWEFLAKKKSDVFKVFFLYFKWGMTIKEIAFELDISESCVKHRLYRTLEELNEHFNEGGVR